MMRTVGCVQKKKECVSTVIDNVKVQKQKRLILITLNAFMNKNTHTTKLVDQCSVLRLKWCSFRII